MKLINTTVLSNFCKVLHPTLLRDAFGHELTIPEQVVDELSQGITKGKVPPTDLSWI